MLSRDNALVTSLELGLAGVNTSLLYVPGVSVFSLDDDHQRLRSSTVAQMTTLRDIDYPQNAMGPINNALCSALNPCFWQVTVRGQERN